MKCKREGCAKPVTGKALYCSGACRVKQARSVTTVTEELGASVTSSPESVTVSPASVTDVTVPAPSVTSGGKCYNRLAIRCPGFGTRPCPVAATDQPIPHNRGRYKRLDGTVYQFDAGGQVFECKHLFTDRAGKPHLAVYETAQDVREAV